MECEWWWLYHPVAIQQTKNLKKWTAKEKNQVARQAILKDLPSPPFSCWIAGRPIQMHRLAFSFHSHAHINRIQIARRSLSHAIRTNHSAATAATSCQIYVWFSFEIHRSATVIDWFLFQLSSIIGYVMNLRTSIEFRFFKTAKSGKIEWTVTVLVQLPPTCFCDVESAPLPGQRTGFRPVIPSLPSRQMTFRLYKVNLKVIQWKLLNIFDSCSNSFELNWKSEISLRCNICVIWLSYARKCQ